MSFGFKYGIPSLIRIVFDVRLPIVLWADFGRRSEVQDYGKGGTVFGQIKGHDRISDSELYSGKVNQLVISIGCTGGKHRSDVDRDRNP